MIAIAGSFSLFWYYQDVQSLPCMVFAHHLADAVLNANYLMSRLSKVIPPAFGAERCMHE